MSDQRDREHKRQPTRYQGAVIQVGDNEILKALDTQLKTPIPNVDEVESDTFGLK